MRIRIPVHGSVHSHFRDFGLRDLALETIGIPKSRTRFAYHRIPPRLDCFVKHRLEGRDTRFQTDQTDRTLILYSIYPRVRRKFCPYISASIILVLLACVRLQQRQLHLLTKGPAKEKFLIKYRENYTRAKDTQFFSCAITEYGIHSTVFK